MNTKKVKANSSDVTTIGIHGKIICELHEVLKKFRMMWQLEQVPVQTEVGIGLITAFLHWEVKRELCCTFHNGWCQDELQGILTAAGLYP